MEAVTPERRSQILELLAEIEQANGIRIIHAVESGSRAWGFPSSDSDYDIRFFYHHSPEWYISAFEKKDHMELEISDDLDTGGWDIGKTLRLLHKGNAVVHEWLHSPVVYRSDERKTALIRSLAAEVFNSAPVFHHYRSLAKKKLADEATRTNAKYFLYGLRSLLCAKWIVDEASAPPVLFTSMVEAYFPSEVHAELDEVLRVKALGAEKDDFEIPKALWAYAEDLYHELTSADVVGDKCIDLERFDLVLRGIIGKSM